MERKKIRVEHRVYVSLYVYIKKVNYEKKYFDNAISSRIRISILGQMSKDKNLLYCLSR